GDGGNFQSRRVARHHYVRQQFVVLPWVVQIWQRGTKRKVSRARRVGQKDWRVFVDRTAVGQRRGQHENDGGVERRYVCHQRTQIVGDERTGRGFYCALCDGASRTQTQRHRRVRD